MTRISPLIFPSPGIPDVHDKIIRSIGSVSRQRHGANPPSAPFRESAVQDRRSGSRAGAGRDYGPAGGSASGGERRAAAVAREPAHRAAAGLICGDDGEYEPHPEELATGSAR